MKTDTRKLSITSAIIVLIAGTSSKILSQDYNGVQINTDAFGNNILNDAANEPSYAINPLDPDVMVVGWRQFDTISSDVRYAGYAYSWDGGKSWTNGGILDYPPGSGSYANQSDPVLAVDNNGAFFYNSLIFRSARDGQTVYRSDDSGVNWGLPIYIVDGFSDKNWYNIDRSGASNHHYCIWGNSDIWFTRSTDEGVSWMTPMAIGGGISSYVSIGPDGEVYTGWWEYWNDRVVIRKSDNAKNSGQTPSFGSDKILQFGAWPWLLPLNPDGGAGQVYVEADISNGPRRGYVYALSSAVTSTDVCDVMFSRSTDGGNSWSNPAKINDDTNTRDYQWMAAMSISPSGRLDALWYDTRDDPNHFLSRLYYAFSYDGGLTWANNRAVSDQFDTSVGWPQQQKIGDYYQCLSDNGGVGIVYPNTLNGEEDLYFLRTHPISLDASPLVGGQVANISVTDAIPNKRVWLTYSIKGEGRTYVPLLDVDIELNQPQQAGSIKVADANGSANWSVMIPSGFSGRNVWIQVVQVQNASNIIADTIQ